MVIFTLCAPCVLSEGGGEKVMEVTRSNPTHRLENFSMATKRREQMNISEETLKKIYTMSFAGLIAYIMEVGEKIGREEAIRLHAKLHAGMADMIKENLSQLGVTGNDARAGMALIDAVMEEHYPGFTSLMERERTEDTPERVVGRHKGWCAALEACQMLGISPKDFCPIPHEEGFTPLVQVLNPKLHVRLGKIRPEAEYCELIVEL